MWGSLPADGHRPDLAVQAVQRPQVLHPQIVVWLGEQKGQLLPQQAVRRRLSGRGKGHPFPHKPAQSLLVLRGVKAGGKAPEFFHVSVLAAKGQHIHHAAALQNGHRAPCEGLRGGHRPHGGQLQHQVNPSQQSQPRPGPLVQHGGPSTLDPVAAHHGNHGTVLLQSLAGTGNLVGVSGVEGIVFGNDANNLHEIDLLVDYLPLFQKNGCLSQERALK